MKIGFNHISFPGTNIYDYVTEEDIMCYYFGEFTPNRKHYCPFQKESSPSFWIGYKGGHLKWVRYGLFGGKLMSPIDFVMHKYNLDFTDAIDLIYKDLCVDKGVKESYKVEKREYQDIEGAIKKRKWEPYDILYWTQYYFNSDDMKKFKVYPAESYWVKIPPRDFIKKFVNTPNCPMYVYEHKDKHSFTCYRPKADKDDKFRKHNIVDHIMGWEQLPYLGEIVAITSSLKDIIALSKIGVPAVAPHSESYHIEESKVEILKDMFDKVVVVYDNDPIGVENSTKLVDRFNLDYWNVPKIYNGCKDPADLIKAIGPGNFEKLWKKS